MIKADSMLNQVITFAFENDIASCFDTEEEFKEFSDLLAEHGLSHLYQYDKADFE